MSTGRGWGCRCVYRWGSRWHKKVIFTKCKIWQDGRLWAYTWAQMLWGCDVEAAKLPGRVLDAVIAALL